MKSKIAIAEKYDLKIFDRPLPYLYDMKKGKARKDLEEVNKNRLVLTDEPARLP